MTRTPPWALGVRAAFDGERFVDGDVTIADGRIASLGVTPPRGGLIAVPGLVDLQVNGFAGVDLLAMTGEELVVLEEGLARRGVTAYRPTLVTAPEHETVRALGLLRSVPTQLHRLPAHLEGPFLSRQWPGAHRVELLRDPDPALVDRLRNAGTVGHLTLAPELPGGVRLVQELSRSGISIALGHTDATAAQAHQAFDAGASALTHVFNAHRPVLAREPGPAGAALSRDDVWVQCIADGQHVAPDLIRVLHRVLDRHLVAVTDAMPAAGMPDGRYMYAGQAVTVRDGQARLRNGRLAGSVAGLDTCLLQLVNLGMSLETALAAVTSRPGRSTDCPDLGRLRIDGPADIAVLDARLRPVRTLVAGVVLYDVAHRGTGGDTDG